MEPETPGNIGAVSRVMRNFGFTKLVLVDPQCDKDSIEAVIRSKHAKGVLKKAKVVSKKELDKYDYVIGTTAKLCSSYRMRRTALNPSELAEKISIINTKKSKICLLFGREGNGLSNEELSKCDFIVCVNSHKKYPTLNLSHAVGIILYEIFQKIGKENKTGYGIIPVSKKEKEMIFIKLNKVLGELEFTEGRLNTQKTGWQRVIGKSMVTKREALTIIGLWGKILNKFEILKSKK